jgi:hypothetical protein
MSGGRWVRISLPLRLAMVAALVLAGGLAGASHTASAAPVPIYNAPAGGGAITEVVKKVGPFQLDALGGLHSQDEGQGLVPRPAGAYGIKTASFDLVDENDQPIGRHDVHLHHFVIGALNKVDTACPNRKVAGLFVQPLIGSGMERTPITFQDPYALEVNANDAWGAVWHLMNMSGTARTVYVKYTLGVQYGATADNTRFITPFWADARGCPAGETWDVPGNGGVGGVETYTKSWPMPFDGYLIGIGGHLHDGGISITTKHGDGSFLCQNLATYASGMLDVISACPMHDTVTAGEMISVTSRYDNSAPHDDVMGIAVMFLWQGDQGVPPTTTTTEPPPTTTTTGVANVLGASVPATPTAAMPAFTG